MKIGIGIPNQVRNVDPTIIPRWAARSEEAGFSTLGTVGRIVYPGVMDTVALAAAAGATTRIGLFTNVLLAPVWPATLLAKEIAGIDGVSGGRLTLGIGIGGRPDDFVAEGLPATGLGRRLDATIETFRSVWAGEVLEGSTNPAVPAGTRQVPLMFGGMAAASFARMARVGEGYIGGSAPAPMIAPAFDAARTAWRDAGREGSPHLVAITYFAIADNARGKENVFDYYSVSGDYAAIATSVVRDVAGVRESIKEFEAIGADELVFNPALSDLDEVSRLAEIVF